MSIKIWNKLPLIITKQNYLNDASHNNQIYVLRDDLIPFSFGGNKVRKAIKFFENILDNKYDTVITYGSASSNHCRVIANMANMHNLKCIVITPKEDNETTLNSELVSYLNAKVVFSDVEDIKKTIDETMKKELGMGNNTYFIQGGGHGNIGTSAYVEVFDNLLMYEKTNNISFDYIFLASGTGTTHAGLIIGNLKSKANKKIIGISIARSKMNGSKVILESINDYISENNQKLVVNDKDLIFDDSYIVDGYGTFNSEIESVIDNQFKLNGLPLDPTYTGKAFWGMEEYIKKEKITNKNILFIHTGGTPLFFDYLTKKDRKL
jgi:D-cysteine desulfhydrase